MSLYFNLSFVQFGSVKDTDVMSYALYPHVAKEFFKFRSAYGPVDKLETRYMIMSPSQLGKNEKKKIENCIWCKTP